MIPLEKLKTTAAATNQPPIDGERGELAPAPAPERGDERREPADDRERQQPAALVAECVVEQAQRARRARRTRRRARRRPRRRSRRSARSRGRARCSRTRG